MRDRASEQADSHPKTIEVKGMILGKGAPKVCVPIVEATEEGILSAAAAIKRSSADLAEWRMDFYQEAADPQKAAAVACALRKILGEKPLLCTYRTRQEGGSAAEELSEEAYEALNHRVIADGQADLIDVELRMGRECIDRLRQSAQKEGCLLVLSYHNFHETPDQDVLQKIYGRMDEYGADVPKIAVMPQTEKDVEVLMQAGKRAAKECSGPLIAISMGAMGMESRIRGEEYGFAMTFASLGKSSAPGQIDVEELRQKLQERRRR